MSADPAVIGTVLPARSRRRPETAFRPAGITRVQEFAYIRSDLRRLIVTACGLFALMLAILVLVNR